MAHALHIPGRGNDSLTKRGVRFAVVLAIHMAVLALLLHVQVRPKEEAAAIRMDVRTIELPPPEPPRPKVEPPPKPPPRTPKPVIRQPDPVPPPPVLTAAPTAEPAPSTFTVPPQPPPAPLPPREEAAAVAAAPPAPVTDARFDADYLQNPAPAYPPLSRRLREEGKVLLLVRVSASGTPESVQVKESSGFARLDQAALGAVRQWRFVPARRGKDPIAADVVVPIVFRLQ